MHDIDLSFFLDPPDLDTAGLLTVEALAPLSMTTAQPGTYYRSQPAPTPAMLYGLIENALGWHFGDDDRKALLKGLRKRAKKALGRGHPLKDTPWITGDDDHASGSGYTPLLQHHLAIDTVAAPTTVHFDDLWARHVRGDSTSFPGGSRNSDVRLERIVNLERRGAIKFGDRKGYDIREPEELAEVVEGDKVHVSAIRPQFPQYYVSPTPREYVLPEGPYRCRLRMTATVEGLVAAAIDDPRAPLYLGTNDGWVHASWEVFS
jgi:CRISPR-associated protein Cas5